MRRKKSTSGQPEWAEQILERLREAEDTEFIEECVYDVIQFGEQAIPVMTTWLSEPNWRQRALAAVALARLQKLEAIPSLMALAKDSHPGARAALCEALAEAGSATAEGTTFLVENLKDREQGTVLYSALRAVGTLKLADESTLPVVEALLDHDSVPVVARAAHTLGQLAHARSVGPLVASLHGEGQYASRTVLESVAGILAAQGPDPVRESLRGLAPEDLTALGEALKEEGGGGKLRPLSELLEHMASSELDRRSLGQFGTLLSLEAQRGRLKPAVLAADRVEPLARALMAPSPRSVLLLGPSGSGKTALVHAVAERLLAAGAEVIEVRAADLIRGKMYIGQWQEHALQLVEAARRPKPVVIYAPDISEWADVGKTVNTEDSVLSALRPYIERQDITILAESTPESFRGGLGRHPQFAALFKVVQVGAASDADTQGIAQHVLDSELARLREANSAVKLDAASDLVRRAMELTAHVYSGQDNPGRTVALLRQLVEEVERRADMQELSAKTLLGERDLLAILERQTGISARLLDDSVPLELPEVRRFFEERVIGQPEAVDTVVDLIALIKAGLTNPEKPLSVMLFVGPTGVGKTELARALAEYLFGTSDRMVRVDLSEFQDPAAMERLIGRTYGHEGGLLTEPVREQPFCIVLLDEIEKAYHGVHDLLLQVFDSGRLTDSRGRTTSFRRAVIVMTSNLGTDAPRGGAVGFLDSAERQKKDAITAVENAFRREFVNRFDHIVAFRSLAIDSMERIARRELERVLSRSGLVRRAVSVDLDPSVLSLILRQGFSPRYGARPLKRAVDQHLLVPIARKLIRTTSRGEEPIVLQVDALRGNSARVRVITEAKRSKPKVAVADPFGEGKREKLDADGIRARADQAVAELDTLHTLAERRDFSGQIASLTAAVGEPGAWADPASARAKATELHALEELASRLTHTRRRAADFVEWVQRSPISRDHNALHRAADTLTRLEADLRLLTFEVRSEGPDDRFDAFVELALLDAYGPGPGPVEMLARMYEGFAKRHGFRFTPLYEEVDDAGRVSLAEAHIEGVSVYGLLRGEEGLHRFLSGGQDHVRPLHVRLRVLPDRPRRPEVLAPTHLIREDLPARPPRVLVATARAALRLTHSPSLSTVCVFAGEDTAASEERALDLLAARVHRAQATDDTPEVTIVRRYTLGHRKEIRDEITGIRTGRVADVLGGRIDPFILARLGQS